MPKKENKTMREALSFFIPQPVPPDGLFLKIRLFSTKKCYTLRGGLVILYATATRTAFAVRVLPFIGFLSFALWLKNMRWTICPPQYFPFKSVRVSSRSRLFLFFSVIVYKKTMSTITFSKIFVTLQYYISVVAGYFC